MRVVQNHAARGRVRREPPPNCMHANRATGEPRIACHEDSIAQSRRVVHIEAVHASLARKKRYGRDGQSAAE